MPETTLDNAEKTTAPSESKQKKRQPKTKAAIMPSNPTEREEAGPYFQLTCDQADLAQHLGLVSHVVPAKPTVAVLGNVLLAADQKTQQVHLTVFNLSLGIRTTFNAKVMSSGETTIPVELLNLIVTKLPAGEVTLSNFLLRKKSVTQGQEEQDQENGLITRLKVEGGEYQVRGISAEEFPALPSSAKSTHTYRLPTEALTEGLKGTIFTASKDETKRIITGVNIKIEANIISFAATDGHRLALVKTSIQGTGNKKAKETPETLSLTVPSKTLTELLRILNSSKPTNEPVELRYEKETETLTLSWGKFYLTSRCLEGDFPPYQDMFAVNLTQTVTIEKMPLIKALERLNTLADNKERMVVLNLQPTSQKLSLSVEREFGKGKEEITAVAEPESDLQIAFNIRYFLEGAKSINTEQIQINITHSLGPCIITPFGNRNNSTRFFDSKYLLMPLQIINGSPK